MTKRKRKKTRSFGELYIKNYLIENNIDYIKEYCFLDCLSENGHPLRYDFFLPDYNLLIEFQGQHHYHPVNKGWRAKKITKQTQLRDVIKKNYAFNNKIALLEIPYWEKDNIKQILDLLFDWSKL